MEWHIAARCSGPAGHVFFWNRERNLTRSPRPIARTCCETQSASCSQHWTSELPLALLHTATVLLLFLIIDYSELLQPIEPARMRRGVKLYMGLITTDSWSGSTQPTFKMNNDPTDESKTTGGQVWTTVGILWRETKLSEHDFEGRNTQRRVFWCYLVNLIN